MKGTRQCCPFEIDIMLAELDGDPLPMSAFLPEDQSHFNYRLYVQVYSLIPEYFRLVSLLRTLYSEVEPTDWIKLLSVAGLVPCPQKWPYFTAPILQSLSAELLYGFLFSFERKLGINIPESVHSFRVPK